MAFRSQTLRWCTGNDFQAGQNLQNLTYLRQMRKRQSSVFVASVGWSAVFFPENQLKMIVGWWRPMPKTDNGHQNDRQPTLVHFGWRLNALVDVSVLCIIVPFYQNVAAIAAVGDWVLAARLFPPGKGDVTLHRSPIPAAMENSLYFIRDQD